MKPIIRILSGTRRGEVISLTDRPFVIGRESDCQIQLSSLLVSRHHCALHFDEYTLRIRDLGSKNGTAVNRSKIGVQGVVLVHGDMVSIGELTFEIDMAEHVRHSSERAEIPSLESNLVPTTDVLGADTAVLNQSQVVPEAPATSITA